MSLAQPPPHQNVLFNPPSTSFNPFSPNSSVSSDHLGLDPLSNANTVEGLHAPQGRVPVTAASFGPPSRGDSRPDFSRGFGLDVPEEEEEPEEKPYVASEDVTDEGAPLDGTDEFGEYDGDDNQDGMTTAAQSRLHSRHVSRLSDFSHQSAGSFARDLLREGADIVPLRSPVGNPAVDDLDQDAIGEWTGSETEEHLHTAETSEDEVRVFSSSLHSVFH